MPTEIVVDTCVLRDRDCATWLRGRVGGKYVPAVAYAESARYALKQGEDLQRHHEYLTRTLGLLVERMEHRHAQVAAQLAHNDGAAGGWHGNARDYFIAAHVAGTGRVLITENLNDFTCLGKAAIPIQEAIKRL